MWKKIFVLVAVLFILLSHGTFANGGSGACLTIADFLVTGERNRHFITPGETVDLLFVIQNCGDSLAKDVIGFIDPQDPAIAIDVLPFFNLGNIGPQEERRIRGRLTTPEFAENLTIKLTTTVSGKTFYTFITIDFHTELKSDNRSLTTLCDTPAFYLLDEETNAIPKSCKPSIESESIVKVEEDIPIIQLDEQPTIALAGPEKAYQLKRAKLFYGGATLAAWTTGYLFYRSAEDLYINKYPTAAKDATDIHQQILTYDRIWQSALAASVPLLVMTIVKHSNQKKQEKKFGLSFMPEKAGMSFSVYLNF